MTEATSMHQELELELPSFIYYLHMSACLAKKVFSLIFSFLAFSRSLCLPNLPQTWQLCLRQSGLHSCWRQNDKVGGINPETQFLCRRFARNNPTRHSPHPIQPAPRPQQISTQFIFRFPPHLRRPLSMLA